MNLPKEKMHIIRTDDEITNATYSSRFQIEKIEEILKTKPRNIAIRTDYGELTLHMLPGSKSRHL